MLGFLQRIGKSLMLPIAVLPAAALLLRLGQKDLFDIPFIAASGNAIFANLALIFAIGVAIGLSRDQSGAAGLAGAIGYLVLTEGTKAINKDINMAILGGILSGIVAGSLYNRFYKIKLPDWLGFFGGKRFVPIITAASMVILAGIFGFIWPPIQSAINALGHWIIGAGAIGVGLYGLLNRLLIPVGLHHVLNSLVWFVFGEYKGATGDLNRFFAGDPSAGIFMTGFFPIMMFGLPAAGFAMIAASKPEQRKKTAGLLAGIALTSFLTGITEPLEFSFMFLSPLLYGIHAVLTASSMMVTYLLGIHHGFGFSAGAIDFFLNLGLATKPWLLFGIGIIYAIIYFFVFYFLITRLDIKTPGRVEDDETSETDRMEMATGGDKYDTMAQYFIQDLGGRDNINTIDNCTTRLRLTIDNMNEVKEDALKRHGARGIIKVNKTNLQVIVGTDVEFVADAMKSRVENGEAPSAQKPKKVEDAKPCDTMKGEDFILPMKGRVIPIEEIPDEAFSSRAMGDGFGIEPAEGTVAAPVDGEIMMLFPSKHAVGIKTSEGHEILIHVGVDTVKLDGQGFESFVNEGDQVKKGQKLLKADLDAIKDKVPSTTTAVLFTNLTADQKLTLKKTGDMEQGESNIFEFKTKQ